MGHGFARNNAVLLQTSRNAAEAMIAISGQPAASEMAQDDRTFAGELGFCAVLKGSPLPRVVEGLRAGGGAPVLRPGGVSNRRTHS